MKAQGSVQVHDTTAGCSSTARSVTRSWSSGRYGATARAVDVICGQFHRNRLLCAVQIHETVDARSLDELKPRFEWWATRIYGLNAAGQRHGLLLGTKGWTP